ncbi:hypothetical protein [Campylobacter sp. CCS1377]|uniref:Filamentous haemagglutinin FhaB/tRNA nuclease CdiA-like TPS domain-containing protein n=1 Tax=Campylobacter sp. CCS1377 TaxID=3158229 RepID=A0AAU7E3S6_9BACT
MRDLSLGKHLTLSFVVSSMLFNSALALPSGGSFVNGSHGNISQNGNNMNITGTTSGGKHVIAWGGGFNIGAGETVNFTTDGHYYLNLDYSKNSSKLFGKLNGGTNNIFLVNPNGTIIGSGASINANKFAVSTKALNDVQMQKFMQTGEFSPVFEPSIAGNIDIQKGADIKVSELALVGDKIVFAGGVNAAAGLKVEANAINVEDGKIDTKNINFTASTLIQFTGGVINTTNLNAKAGINSQKGQINLSKKSDINVNSTLTFNADNIQGSANITANTINLTATDAINLNGGTISAANQSLSSNWIKLEDTTLTNATNITLKGTGNQSVVELEGATLNLSGTLDIDAYQVELNKKGNKDTTITGTNQAKVDIDATNQIAFNGVTFNSLDIDLQATNKIDIKDTVLNIAGKTLKMLSKGGGGKGGIINIESTTTPNYDVSGNTDTTLKNLELQANDINLNQGTKLSADNMVFKASNALNFNNANLRAYWKFDAYSNKYIGVNKSHFVFMDRTNPARFKSDGDISLKDSTFSQKYRDVAKLDFIAANAIEFTNNTFRNINILNANAKQITYNSGTIENSVGNVNFTTTDNQLLIKGGNINATNVTLSADKYLNISGGTFNNSGTLKLLGKNLIDLSGGTITAKNIDIDKINGGVLTLNITKGSFSANNAFTADADKITVGDSTNQPTIKGTNTLTFTAKQIYMKNGSVTSNDLDFTAKDGNKGLIEITGGTITGSINADFISDNYIHLKGGNIKGGFLNFSSIGKISGNKGGTIDFDGTTVTSDKTDGNKEAIVITADQINFKGGAINVQKGTINADANHKIVVDGTKFDAKKLDLYAKKEVELKKGFGDGMDDGQIDIGTGDGGNIDISLGDGETIKGENLTFKSYYIDLKSGTLQANKNLHLEAYNNFALSGTAKLKANTMDLITHNVMTISGGTLEANTLNIKGINDKYTDNDASDGQGGGVEITISGGTLNNVGNLNTSGADELNFNNGANWNATTMNLNSKRIVLNGGTLNATKLNFGTQNGGTQYIDIQNGTLNATDALKLYATNLITISGGNLKGKSVELTTTTNSTDKGVIDLQGGVIEANGGTITANASQIISKNGENGSTGSGVEFKASTLTLNATNNLRVKGGNFNAVANLNFKGKAGIEFSGGTFGNTSKFILSSDGLVDISRNGELKVTSFIINGYNGSGNAGGINFKNMNLVATDNIAFNATKQLIIESGKLESSKNITLNGLGSLQISGDSTSIKGASVNLNSNNWISIKDASLEATSGTLSIQAKADNQANGTGKVIDILGSANLKASNGTIDIDAQEINIGEKDKNNLTLDAKTIDLSANNRVNINNGTFTATGDTKNGSSPDFSIWGGQSINILGNATLQALNGLLKLNTFNKINISAGTLKANQLILNAKPNNSDITKGGIIDISGGTLENTGDKFELTANQINTNGGTFNANGNLKFTADNKIVINNGTFNVKNGTFTLDGKKQIDLKGGIFDFGSDGSLTLQSSNNGLINYTLTEELSVKDFIVNAGEINLVNANINASGKFDFDATQWIRINTSTLAATGNADITAKAMEFSGGAFKAANITLNTGGLLNIKDNAKLEATGGDLTIVEKANSGNSELNLDNGSSLKASGDIKIDTDELNIKGALNADNITLGDTNAQNINITDSANINATTALVLKAIKSILIDGTKTQLQGATIDFTNSGYTHIINGIINAATSIKFTQNGKDNLLRIEGGTISTGNAGGTKSGSIEFAGNEANVEIWGGEFETGELKANNVKQFILGKADGKVTPNIDVTTLTLQASHNLALIKADIMATSAKLLGTNLVKIAGANLNISGDLEISGDKRVEITSGKIDAQNINFITKNYIFLGGTSEITATKNIDFIAFGSMNGKTTGTVEFADNVKVNADTITIGDTQADSNERVEQIIFNGGEVGAKTSIKGYAKQVYVKNGTIKTPDLYLEGREKISLTGGTIDNGGKFIEFVSGQIIELGIALKSTDDIKLTAPQLNIVKGANIEAGKNLTLISTGLNGQPGKGGLFLGGGNLSAGETLTLIGENGIAMLDDPSALTISGKVVNLFSNNYINITGSITGENVTLSGFEKKDDGSYISKTGQNTVIELANTDITGKSKDSSTLTIDGKQINLSGSKTISNFKTADFKASNQIALNGGVFKNIAALNLLGAKEVLIAGAMIKEGISALNIKSDNHIALKSGEVATSSLNLSGLSDGSKPKVIDFSGASVSVNEGDLSANANQINITGGSVNANNITFNATNIKASGGTLKASEELKFTTEKLDDTHNGMIEISGTASLEAETLSLISANLIKISGGTLKGTNINLGDDANKNTTVIDILGGTIGDNSSTIAIKGAQLNIGDTDKNPTINGNLTADMSNQIVIKNGILNLLTANLSAANLIDISGGTIKANALTLNASDTNKGKIAISGAIIQGNGDAKTLEANAKWIDISGGEIKDFSDATLKATDILQVSGSAKLTNNTNATLQGANALKILGGTFSGEGNLKLLSDNLVEISGGIFSVKTDINGITDTGSSTANNSSLKELVLKGGTFNKQINAYAKDMNFASGTITFNASSATFMASNYLKFGSATINANSTSALSFNATKSILASGTIFNNTAKDSTITFQTTDASGYIGLTNNTKISGFNNVNLNSSKDLELNKATIDTKNLSLKSSNNTVIASSSLSTSDKLSIEAIKDLSVNESSTLTINGGNENSIKAQNISFSGSKLVVDKSSKLDLETTTFKSLNSQISLLGGSTLNANAKDIIIKGSKDGLSAILGGSSALNLKASNVVSLENAVFKHKNSNGNENANKINIEATSKITAKDTEFALDSGQSSAEITLKTTADNGTIELENVKHSASTNEAQSSFFKLQTKHANFKGGNTIDTMTSNADYITIAGANTFTKSTLDAQKLIDIKEGSTTTLDNSTLKSASELKATNATINLKNTVNFYAQNQRFTGTNFSGAGSTLNFKGYNGDANKIEFSTGTNFNNIQNIIAVAKGILVDTGKDGGFLSGINKLDLGAKDDLTIKGSTVKANDITLDGSYLYISNKSNIEGNTLKLNTDASFDKAYLKIEDSSIKANESLTLGADNETGSVIDILNNSSITSNKSASIYADAINLKNSQLILSGNSTIKALSKFLAQNDNAKASIKLSGNLTIDGGKEIEFNKANIEKSGDTAKIWLRTTKDLGSGSNGKIKFTQSQFGTSDSMLDLIQISNPDGNNVGANDFIVDNSSIYTTSMILKLANLIEFKNGSNITANTFKAENAKLTKFNGASFTINNGTDGSGIFTEQILFTNSTFTLNSGKFAFGNASTKYVKFENNKDSGKGLWVNGTNGGTLTFEGQEIDFKTSQLTTNNNTQNINFNSTGDINFDGATFTTNGGTANFYIGSRNNSTLNIDFKDTIFNKANGTLNLDLMAKTSENKGGKISLGGLKITNEINLFKANANWIDIANGAEIKAARVDLSTPGKILMSGGTIITNDFVASSGAGTGNIYLQGGKIQATNVTLQGNEVQILKKDGNVNKSGTTISSKDGRGLAEKVSVGSYNGKDTNHAYILANTVFAKVIENNGKNKSWTSMDISALRGNDSGWGGNGPQMTGSARKYLNIATDTNARNNAQEWYDFVQWFNEGNRGINSYDEYVLLNDIDFNWANLAKKDGLGNNTYGLIHNFESQTLNGNGHTLKNFNIGTDQIKFSGSGDGNMYAGLILNAGKGSVFKNITIEGAWMHLNGNTIQYAGILAGKVDAGARFENINFKSNLGVNATLSRNSTVYVGGIVGLTTNGSTFQNIDINGIKVTATQDNGQPIYVGGIVGQIQGGSTIDHIYVNGVEVSATSKDRKNRAYSGGFAGTMRGDVAIHDIAMKNIKSYATGAQWSMASALTSKEYSRDTTESKKLKLNLTINDVYLHVASLSVNSNQGSRNDAIDSFFVGAYQQEGDLWINGILAKCDPNQGQCKPSKNYNITIYTTWRVNGYDGDGIDGKFMSANGYPSRMIRQIDNDNGSQWESAVRSKYGKLGFYTEGKTDIAVPGDVINIADQNNDGKWTGATEKDDVSGPSGTEKETNYEEEGTSAANNDSTVTDVGDISVSDGNSYTGSTGVGEIGNDYTPTTSKTSDDIAADQVVSTEGKKPENLDNSITEIIDGGVDKIANLTPPKIDDITGDSEDTINNAGDTTATTDNDINYDTGLANDKADMGDESGFVGNSKQPGDIDGNENGNGGSGGGSGVSNLTPNDPNNITNTGKGNNLTITPPKAVVDNAGSLINKNFTNISYTDKAYSFSSNDYDNKILEEILKKITDGYYTLDINDFAEAYEAAIKGDIVKLLSILQVADVNFESIRQAMDFMMAFYDSKGQGLGETIKAKGGEKFKTYNQKAHQLNVDKGALWTFIFGAGGFEDKIENYFKDYEKYKDYESQLIYWGKMYNDFKALIDSGIFGDENSQKYKDAMKQLEEYQTKYNEIKDQADAYIKDVMKGQSDYILSVFVKTDKDSNGHFKFTDESGKIGDYDYVSKIPGGDIPDLPDKQPEVPEPPQIDSKMFSDVTDHAQVLENEEEENEIDEAAGEERQRLCVVSDNAKAMNQCLAPK